jgi:RNA polymerase sigma factor (sigma-70 family)
MNERADPIAADAAQRSPFPQTLWTLVLQAARGDEEKSSEALGRLCVLYREPVRLYLVRSGRPPDDAEDLTQSFMAHLLEGNRFKNVEPRATKFRSYLIECLRRFVRGEWRKETAQKRGGGAGRAEWVEAEVGITPQLEQLLDLDFARVVHQRALARLETEYADESKRARLAELRRFIWGNDQSLSYAQAAEHLDLTPNHVKKAVFDLRRRYYRSFREEVLHTVASEMVDVETRYLMTLVAGDSEAH